jgi:hypothetical protein
MTNNIVGATSGKSPELFSNGRYRCLLVGTQLRLAAQRIREESVQRYRITRGAAQPVDFGRGIAVDPDE